MRTLPLYSLLALLPWSCTTKVEPEADPAPEAAEEAAADQGPAKVYVHVVSKGYEHQVAKLGEGGAPSLVEAKRSEWAAADERFEVLYVDDGSNDGSSSNNSMVQRATVTCNSVHLHKQFHFQ